MLFRPEEIHAASGEAPGHFLGQGLCKRDVHMADHGGRIYFDYAVVLHANANWLAAVKTAGID